jgi:protein-S-isoprenylcysteine O-methyltransferase Ste14
MVLQAGSISSEAAHGNVTVTARTFPCDTGYLRHPMYGGLLMASFGLAIVTRNETRMALAALLWVVLEQKVCRLCLGWWLEMPSV